MSCNSKNVKSDEPVGVGKLGRSWDNEETGGNSSRHCSGAKLVKGEKPESIEKGQLYLTKNRNKEEESGQGMGCKLGPVSQSSLGHSLAGEGGPGSKKIVDLTIEKGQLYFTKNREKEEESGQGMGCKLGPMSQSILGQSLVGMGGLGSKKIVDLQPPKSTISKGDAESGTMERKVVVIQDRRGVQKENEKLGQMGKIHKSWAIFGNISNGDRVLEVPGSKPNILNHQKPKNDMQTSKEKESFKKLFGMIQKEKSLEQNWGKICTFQNSIDPEMTPNSKLSRQILRSFGPQKNYQNCKEGSRTYSNSAAVTNLDSGVVSKELCRFDNKRRRGSGDDEDGEEAVSKMRKVIKDKDKILGKAEELLEYQEDNLVEEKTTSRKSFVDCGVGIPPQQMIEPKMEAKPGGNKLKHYDTCDKDPAGYQSNEGLIKGLTNVSYI